MVTTIVVVFEMVIIWNKNVIFIKTNMVRLYYFSKKTVHFLWLTGVCSFCQSFPKLCGARGWIFLKYCTELYVSSIKCAKTLLEIFIRNKKIRQEQESIPVGCVLPALHRTGGVCQRRETPRQRPPWIETPGRNRGPETEIPTRRNIICAVSKETWNVVRNKSSTGPVNRCKTVP